MNYNFDEKTNKMLKELEEQILEEYDNSPDIHVRVNLLPLYHNTTSEYEKIVDENGNRTITINKQNEEHDKTVIAIHEASGGLGGDQKPTKPPEKAVDIPHYEELLIKGRNGNKYGDTIGYHAMIAHPGLNDRPEIVLYMPATFSPNQVGNAAYQKYAYGIERLCGDEQNYHLAIANQAMLTAFVLKEIGYDKETAMRHVFPHHFFVDRNKIAEPKECPARMLYASKLLDKTRDGTELTEEELETLKEYVPWQVFHSLVGEFFERDKFPPELEEKFIYDIDDYKAYMENPKAYNYAQRRKNKVSGLHNIYLTNEEEKTMPISLAERKIQQYKYGSQIKSEPPKISIPKDFER